MSGQVLVTGGAGYLGSVLCEQLLREGFRVTILDNLHWQQAGPLHLAHDPRFDFVHGDARDEALVRRLLAPADVVVPLACIVGAPACDRDPVTATSVNLEAVKLLDRLRSPRQLVVFPVTNSGYGTRSGDVHCTEEKPLEPISHYGRTKVEAERALLARPNTITLRLATVFGLSSRMRLDLLVNDFVHAAATQGVLVIFERAFKRNFIHIRDVADCFVHAIRNAPAMVGRPYNAGLDSANISKEELAQKVAEHVPGLYVHFCDVKSDPDKRNYIVSNERLRRAGFEARRSLDEGIRELLVGYRMLPRSAFKNV